MLVVKIFKINNNKDVKDISNKTDKKICLNLKNLKNTTSKILIYIIIRVIKELIFLISNNRKIFNYYL